MQKNYTEADAGLSRDGNKAAEEAAVSEGGHLGQREILIKATRKCRSYCQGW